MSKRTKIICTLGPASSGRASLVAMIKSGMDVARLNFSHGTPGEHASFVKNVRFTARSYGKPVGILQDLPGPKLRLGKLPEEGLKLEQGEEIIISSRMEPGLKTLPFRNIPVLKALRPGNHIYLSDGRVHLRVLKNKSESILCRVVSGTILMSGSGVNIPGVDLPVESLTKADRKMMRFGLSLGVDFVAVSFVSGAQDLLKARKAAASAARPPLIIAKIERAQALHNLREIVKAADAVMVARGDLGVELPPEKVPFVQKEITAECRRQGRPVIVATQMLESMVNSPFPTRAELTDIACAATDGADAVMLSAETSIGKYPAEAVLVLAKVLAETEKHLLPPVSACHTGGCSEPAAAAAAAVALARGLGAKALIIPTFTGETVRMVSLLRPDCPILAICRPGCETGMSMFWGVKAVPAMVMGKNLETVIGISRKISLRTKLAVKGDRIVVSCTLPGSRDARTVTAVRV